MRQTKLEERLTLNVCCKDELPNSNSPKSVNQSSLGRKRCNIGQSDEKSGRRGKAEETQTRGGSEVEANRRWKFGTAYVWIVEFPTSIIARIEAVAEERH